MKKANDGDDFANDGQSFQRTCLSFVKDGFFPKFVTCLLEKTAIFQKTIGEIMNYRTLKKIYYADEKKYEAEYSRRFHAPFTQHLGIDIQEYNRKNAYPAFLVYTQEMALLMEKIYKKYEALLYVIHSVPDVVLHQFTLLSILEEVKSTNEIEGIHSTRKELREIIDGTAPRSARFDSIIGKYDDLLGGIAIDFTTCRSVRNFYDDFARKEVVAENPANELDGKIFRKNSVDIDSASGKTIHRGIMPEARIIELLQNALDFLHDEDVPLLVRISAFHYFFAYIHPFYDGNGRTDRFITSYFLAKHFHPLAALRLSVYIKKNRSSYYSLFREADDERNRGDMTPFILGFCQILLSTFEDTISILERKKKKLETYTARIAGFSGDDALLHEIYYILLQAALFYGQGIPMKRLMELTKKSQKTVMARLEAMPQEHVIITTVNRVKYYKLNLFLFK